MKIKGTPENGLVVAVVEGRLDAVSAAEFDRACGEWWDAGTVTFILDFSRLEYISSAGLRSLLILGKKSAAKNGRVVVAAMKDAVKEIFTISGFDKILAMADSVESALKRD